MPMPQFKTFVDCAAAAGEVVVSGEGRSRCAARLRISPSRSHFISTRQQPKPLVLITLPFVLILHPLYATHAVLHAFQQAKASCFELFSCMTCIVTHMPIQVFIMM